MVFIALVVTLSFWFLSAAIYLLSLYLAYLNSFVAVLAVLFFPGIAQLYILWEVWSFTGVFLNYFTLLCIGWMALLVANVSLSIAMDQ